MALALSRLSREAEKRDDTRPHLFDPRDPGSIEQDADVVMFAFREEYYLAQGAEEAKLARSRQAEADIAKNHRSPAGTPKLSFDGQTTSFGDGASQA
ncbi:DnaB-like helicase C-terminal domain-containing protein [Reyranella sp.]|uniref:DnaB-like helicase C-terminal domain-containing protein n=1 Tax=Reyranella sp. TaxID=1929291 RepID=UPI003C7DDABD